MMNHRSPWRPHWYAPATALCVVLLCGCGDNSGVGKTYPVSGKITFNRDPLTAESVSVLLKPDGSRGNTTLFEPVGMVDEEGNYRVVTRGKDGAPPGWYKVIVAAHDGAIQHPKGPRNKRPVAHSLLPARYGSPKTTDLAFEVVENPVPGAYDLKLAP
jgi:hypothetical protein